jgi:FkbM family methyltransferase
MARSTVALRADRIRRILTAAGARAPSRAPSSMLAALKHHLPEPLLAAMRQVRARSRHLVYWQGRPLFHDLSSGVSVEITSASDWAIYNEMFVEGEYDRAIRAVSGSPGDDPYVLDLGANVGFFALRFADIWLRERGATSFQVLSIAGSPRTYAQLARNIHQPALVGHCTTSHGLIGRRAGHGWISTSMLAGLNSMYTRQSLSRARVRFVDLEQLVPADRQIALVKCDIEGAEQHFLESYPALLRRVHALVIEFHHDLCQVARCRTLLEAAGLVHHRQLRRFPGCSVELFNRHPFEPAPDATSAAPIARSG